ncbi:MAG: PDZ domain-containing protein, partial [Chloroflexota bacterium]|nr:PDZ domain-containing protein [Chloroflexota bacterium]
MDISFPSIFGRLRRQWSEQQRYAVWCYLPRFLLALLMLALLGAVTWVVTWPTAGLDWQLSEGRILSMIPGGPGEQAGLRPGDVVLAVDGQPFVDVPLYAGYHPGEIVVLTVQRGANIRDFSLRLAVPDRVDLLWRSIPVIVALTFWGTAVVVFFLRPVASTPRAFFLLGQIATLTLATGQLSAVNVAWATRLFNLALCALLPLLVHFYGTLSTFPLFLRRRWWVPFLFVSLLLAFP